ncbi:MAG: hypothetical protein ED557_05915 [Balneola sp.]|nr:MAG: hypothetical protein ED557_05915 [Balneola sp.]
MKEFNLQVDTSTSYMKVFRAIGIIGVILFATSFVLEWTKGEDIDWINTVTGIIYSSIFLFFPEILRKQSLTFNEEGILRHNYNTYWGEKNEFEWDNISELTLRKNKIVIKNKVGSSERIKLPVYTNEQLSELKTYLKEMAEVKEFELKEK